MDLLRYSETRLNVCFRDKTRREMYDILRQVAVYPERISICPCVADPWIRKTLAFLRAQYSNEPSHRESGPGESGSELASEAR